MAGYVVTAPLNLAGPWGTVAWIVAGTVVTVGAAVGLVKLEESIRADSRAKDIAIPHTGTRTETKKCDVYSVRVHAQGVDCGGTSSSTIGAPALVKPVPISVAEALLLSAATQVLLNRTQRKDRTIEIAKAENYIRRGPGGGGYYGPKSYLNFKLRGGIRYDVDCLGCGRSLIY